jgi:hypothetical protein
VKEEVAYGMVQLCCTILLRFVEPCLPNTYHRAVKTRTGYVHLLVWPKDEEYSISLKNEDVGIPIVKTGFSAQ